MFKKTVTYEDYKGNTRTEDFYFNLNKAELLELELSTTGGLTVMMDRIMAAQDNPTLFRIFKELVAKSYGVMSDDGRKFIKNEKVLEDFMQTEAYSIIFSELAMDAEAAAEFFNNVIPQKLAEELAKEANK